MSHPHPLADLTAADNTAPSFADNTELAFHLAEYTSLKAEQVDKMRTRDQLVYVTLVVIGAIGYAALIEPGQPMVMLALPFACAVLGLVRVSNDLKVESIRTHLRNVLTPRIAGMTGGRVVLQWELTRTRTRYGRVVQMIADLGVFVLPGLVGVGWVAVCQGNVLGVAAALLVGAVVFAFPLALAVQIVQASR